MVWFYLVAKSNELRKDIEILSQTFERIIDSKDAVLKSLVRDLEEAEEQYQTAMKSHLQSLRKLLGKNNIIVLRCLAFMKNYNFFDWQVRFKVECFLKIIL